MAPISQFSVTFKTCLQGQTAWKTVIQKSKTLKRHKPKMVAKHWILSSQLFISVALALASVHKRDREYFGSTCAKQIPDTDV